MSRTRIKICGLRSVDDALCAAEAGADAVGFVFVDRSPRCVTAMQVAAIVKALPAFVEPVALFADAPIDQVRMICETTGIRTLQLHGREDQAYVQSLHEYRVIKAINFGDEAQKIWLQRGTYASCAAVGLLVDAPAEGATPRATGLTGGSGQPFDWNALASLNREGLPPLILAGGLNPSNVAQAITVVHPFAVDVSSGVESSRGIKNQAKIRDFCAAVQHADADRR